MLEIDNTERIPTAPTHSQGLPLSREQWPAEAQSSYRRLISELNSWCRTHGSAPGTNSWVAETAVREAWS